MDWSDALDVALRGLAHLAAAAGVLAVGVVLARVVRMILRRALGNHETTLGPSVVRLATATAYYVLVGLAVGASLIALGISPTFVSAIFILILVVLAVALRQSIADLAATVAFLVFQPFKRDDMIETMGYLGTVREILLLNTVLLLPDERLVSLPNSRIQDTGVVNYTRMGRVRIDFNITVGYQEDLDHIRKVVAQVASEDGRILRSPPFQIVTEELTEVGVLLRVLPTVAPRD